MKETSITLEHYGLDERQVELLKSMTDNPQCKVILGGKKRGILEPQQIVLAFQVIMPFLSLMVAGLAKAMGEDLWKLIKEVAKKSWNNKQEEFTFELLLQDEVGARRIKIDLNGMDSPSINQYLESFEQIVPKLINLMNEDRISRIWFNELSYQDKSWEKLRARNQKGEIVLVQI